MLVSSLALNNRIYELRKRMLCLMLGIFIFFFSMKPYNSFVISQGKTACQKAMTYSVECLANCIATAKADISNLVTSSMALSPTKEFRLSSTAQAGKGRFALMNLQEEVMQSKKAIVLAEETSTPEAVPQFAVFIHIGQVSDGSNFYWVPEVLTERVSNEDILVDLSEVIDPALAVNLSDRDFYNVCKEVYQESRGESFLGQLLTAEEFLDRLRSPYFGTTVSEIAVGSIGYGAWQDANGELHFGSGDNEILEVSESCMEAVRIAMRGTKVSVLILQAITELINEQYGLQLDDSYYKWGAMYHYAPERLTDETAISRRSFGKVPVSFQVQDHIFYGKWLSDSAALNIQP